MPGAAMVTPCTPICTWLQGGESQSRKILEEGKEIPGTSPSVAAELIE